MRISISLTGKVFEIIFENLGLNPTYIGLQASYYT